MIAELVEDQKLAVLELGDQVIRRKFRIGFLRPRLDLNISKPVVTGLSSLKRTSEAVMEYSEVDEMPNFNVKFNAQLSNVNAKGGVKGKVSHLSQSTTHRNIFPIFQVSNFLHLRRIDFPAVAVDLVLGSIELGVDLHIR